MIKKRRKQPRKKVGKCPFCEAEKTSSYKEYKELAKYMNDRARIINRAYTGVCSGHQRQLSVSIKRARHLGLLPFAPKLK